MHLVLVDEVLREYHKASVYGHGVGSESGAVQHRVRTALAVTLHDRAYCHYATVVHPPCASVAHVQRAYESGDSHVVYAHQLALGLDQLRRVDTEIRMAVDCVVEVVILEQGDLGGQRLVLRVVFEVDNSLCWALRGQYYRYSFYDFHAI